MLRIEDYALIGDLESAALVARNGSVDWLCLPRFDSPSCFAAILGDEEHGRWRIAPSGAITATSRRYRPGSLVLETEDGAAAGGRGGDGSRRSLIADAPRSGAGPSRGGLRRVRPNLRRTQEQRG